MKGWKEDGREREKERKRERERERVSVKEKRLIEKWFIIQTDIEFQGDCGDGQDRSDDRGSLAVNLFRRIGPLALIMSFT